jgi:hypothetical protein
MVAAISITHVTLGVGNYIRTTKEGTMVRGYALSGFELEHTPECLPPKGTPKLLQWAPLVKSDGTVERMPSKVVYWARLT